MSIQADKRFGQHFLVNEGVIERIATAVETLAKSEGGPREVIEIGPGPGALTGALLKRGLRVLALELDERMLPELAQKFPAETASGQLRVVQADAVKISLDEVRAKLSTPKTVVCGNLPYNVGSQIVFRFLEEFPPADRFCYMLQKEVVLKFITDDRESGQRRDYGPPGIKLHWSCKRLGHFWVGPGSFRPPPKVDSGVFWFERLPTQEALADALERGGAYDRAGEVVEKLFRQRRKMIRASYPILAKDSLGARRAEELSPLDLFDLARLIQSRNEDET